MIWSRVSAFTVLIYFTIPTVYCFRVSDSLNSIQVTSDPDTYLTTPKIIRRHGYPAESHIIKSEDGYLLEYHRIPHGKHMSKATKKFPILLHHGLLCSSIDWIINGPEKSLGYKLADEGYDVWLGNARGNTYSRSHESMTPKQKEFWNFTFHEMGAYDLPSAIDNILNVTNSEKLIYIGHSQGTTMFYVLLSTRPEYNRKILFHVGVAPVTSITHTTSAFRYFVPFAKQIEAMSTWYSNGAFLEHDLLSKVFCKILCARSIFDYNVCEQLIIFKLAGKDLQQFNQTLIPLIMSNMPAGTSGKNMIHSAQLISSGRFAQYDYGLKGNIIKYHTAKSPVYNLSKITIPVKFYYGKNDLISNPLDVHLLYQQIPKPMGCKLIDYEKWNHVDFVWAIDVNRLFNDDLIQFVNNASDNSSFIRNNVKIALWERSQRLIPTNVPFDNEQFLNDDFNGLLTLGNVTEILEDFNTTPDFWNSWNRAIKKKTEAVETEMMNNINYVEMLADDGFKETRNVEDAFDNVHSFYVSITEAKNKIKVSIKKIGGQIKTTLQKLKNLFQFGSDTPTNTNRFDS